VFLNYQAEPISERSVRRLVAGYTAHAGLVKHVSPHTLRRTFATGKHRRGVSLRQVQEWLGHRNINTTQLYVQVDRQDGHKVMEATSL
jgi:site-specific recombinase XerD